MPTEDAYSSGHLVLSHFGTCMCSNVETNLSWTCLVSGLLNFEHPSVLLFCFKWYFMMKRAVFYLYFCKWTNESFFPTKVKCRHHITTLNNYKINNMITARPCNVCIFKWRNTKYEIHVIFFVCLRIILSTPYNNLFRKTMHCLFKDIVCHTYFTTNSDVFCAYECHFVSLSFLIA